MVWSHEGIPVPVPDWRSCLQALARSSSFVSGKTEQTQHWSPRSTNINRVKLKRIRICFPRNLESLLLLLRKKFCGRKPFFFLRICGTVSKTIAWDPKWFECGPRSIICLRDPGPGFAIPRDTVCRPSDQYCGSATCWCRSRTFFPSWCRPDPEPDPTSSYCIGIQLENRIFFTFIHSCQLTLSSPQCHNFQYFRQRTEIFWKKYSLPLHLV